MNFFDPVVFEAFASALAGTTIIDQWDSRVAKVSDKIFALRNEDGGVPRIAFKCSEETFEILTALDGVAQAPYFAKRKWVSVSSTAPLSATEMEHYVRRSYELVAAGLTRKLRRELGIES